MKLSTPAKKALDETTKRKKDQLSPSRQNIMVSRKRDNSQFQPGLYINSKFNEQDIIAIKQAFDAYDSNKTGLLTPNDLKVALFHQGFQASKQTVYNIIAEYDDECLGGLNFAAFIKIITSEPIETQSLSELKKVFRKLDKDNKGFLDRRDLESLLRSLGESIDEHEMDSLLSKIDKKERTRISFEEFCKIMHSPHSLY